MVQSSIYQRFGTAINRSVHAGILRIRTLPERCPAATYVRIFEHEKMPSPKAK